MTTIIPVGTDANSREEYLPTNYDLLIGLVKARESGVLPDEVIDDVFMICARLGYKSDNHADELIDDLIDEGRLLYDRASDTLTIPKEPLTCQPGT